MSATFAIDTEVFSHPFSLPQLPTARPSTGGMTVVEIVGTVCGAVAAAVILGVFVRVFVRRNRQASYEQIQGDAPSL